MSWTFLSEFFNIRENLRKPLIWHKRPSCTGDEPVVGLLQTLGFLFARPSFLQLNWIGKHRHEVLCNLYIASCSAIEKTVLDSDGTIKLRFPANVTYDKLGISMTYVIPVTYDIPVAYGILAHPFDKRHTLSQWNTTYYDIPVTCNILRHLVTYDTLRHPVTYEILWHSRDIGLTTASPWHTTYYDIPVTYDILRHPHDIQHTRYSRDILRIPVKNYGIPVTYDIQQYPHDVCTTSPWRPTHSVFPWHTTYTTVSLWHTTYYEIPVTYDLIWLVGWLVLNVTFSDISAI